MNHRNIYCIIAAILPVLLGLGLIEISMERGPSFGLVAGGLLCLAVLTATITGLAADAATSGSSHGRQRSKQQSRYST